MQKKGGEIRISHNEPALRAIRGIALVASPLAVVTFAHALWMFLEVTAGPVWRTADGGRCDS